MELSLYKDTTTSRGFLYHYYFAPATDASKPTILFLHGFPCSSHDWRKVVPTFKGKGYGVVAPDMLGYGGTSKPTETIAYKLSGICQDLVDILDAEQLDRVVAVGHDWGAAITTRLTNFHPERFTGFAFVGLGYRSPGTEMQYDKVMELTKNTLGYELFGYWKFLAGEDSPRILDEHWDSALRILYSADPNLWKTDMGPPGKLREWLLQDKKAPFASYITPEDIEYASIVRKNGFDGPVNYYRTLLTDVSSEDNKLIPKERYIIHKPVLFIGCERDAINVPAYSLATTRQWCKNLTVTSIDTDHWVLLSEPDKLAEDVLTWLQKLFQRLEEESSNH